MIQHYLVGEHLFAIEAEQKHFDVLSNYAPFMTDELGRTRVFIIHVKNDAIPSGEGWEHVHTDTSDDDMPRIEMYQLPHRWLFRVSVMRDGDIKCAMRCSEDWSEVELFLEPGYERFAIDNAAMLTYAFCTMHRQTLLFHSSVTIRDGKAYMFLGHSGTGKSTHSRQWLETFPEAWLLNDDNPVVRTFDDGSVTVYGSPWSGKTPCYKNEQAPVQALVQLAQAPHNEIKRLRMSQAYPFILASVSGLKILPQAMDAIYESIALLLERTPVFKLECLPDHDAAQLCAQTCSL